jgi:hypothetical protein
VPASCHKEVCSDPAAALRFSRSTLLAKLVKSLAGKKKHCICFRKKVEFCGLQDPISFTRIGEERIARSYDDPPMASDKFGGPRSSKAQPRYPEDLSYDS